MTLTGYPFPRTELIHVLEEMCGGLRGVRPEEVPMET